MKNFVSNLYCSVSVGVFETRSGRVGDWVRIDALPERIGSRNVGRSR
jgi:hypothetical protein